MCQARPFTLPTQLRKVSQSTKHVSSYRTEIIVHSSPCFLNFYEAAQRRSVFVVEAWNIYTLNDVYSARPTALIAFVVLAT